MKLSTMLLCGAFGFLAWKIIEGNSQENAGQVPWYAEYLTSGLKSGYEDGAYATLYPVGQEDPVYSFINSVWGY